MTLWNRTACEMQSESVVNVADRYLADQAPLVEPASPAAAADFWAQRHIDDRTARFPVPAMDAPVIMLDRFRL